MFVPRSPLPAQITLPHQLSNTTLLTQLSLSTRCNRQPHMHSPTSTSQCQCITHILHTRICTRRSRAIPPITRCTIGTTVILHTRRPLPSCIPRPSITRNACHPMLTTLVRPPSSVPSLLSFPRQLPAIRVPQPRLRLLPATKIKSRIILLSTSVRLVSRPLRFLRRTSSIGTRSNRDWIRGPR